MQLWKEKTVIVLAPLSDQGEAATASNLCEYTIQPKLMFSLMQEVEMWTPK